MEVHLIPWRLSRRRRHVWQERNDGVRLIWQAMEIPSLKYPSRGDEGFAQFGTGIQRPLLRRYRAGRNHPHKGTQQIGRSLAPVGMWLKWIVARLTLDGGLQSRKSGSETRFSALRSASGDMPRASKWQSGHSSPGRPKMAGRRVGSSAEPQPIQSQYVSKEA